MGVSSTRLTGSRMATLLLTRRQADVLADRLTRYPVNVFKLHAAKSYGDLEITIHGERGSFSWLVPGNLTDPVRELTKGENIA